MYRIIQPPAVFPPEVHESLMMRFEYSQILIYLVVQFNDNLGELITWEGQTFHVSLASILWVVVLGDTAHLHS